MMRHIAFARAPALLAVAMTLSACVPPAEMSPRYMNPSQHDPIDTSKRFPGVHFVDVPAGWFYVDMAGSGPGDSACLGSDVYDAVFWLSTRPLHDDPMSAVNEVVAMREDLWHGEWLLGVERSPDLASAMYLVDRNRDGRDGEVQKTAFRRLMDSRGVFRTFSLHGRWPRHHHSVVMQVFDRLVATAVYQ